MSESKGFQYFLDARGLECPLPLLKTRLAMKNLMEQQTLLVYATDSGSWQDIPRYLANSQFQLLEAIEVEDEYHFLIAKKVES